MTTLSINSSVVREVDELPQDVRPCFYGIKSSDSKKRESGKAKQLMREWSGYYGNRIHKFVFAGTVQAWMNMFDTFQ